jgi:hypothetical protein
MNFNLGKVVQAINLVSNPKQGINILLDKMGQNNPQMANTIKQAIKSGKNPTKFIMEQAQAGEITLENLNELKSLYGMAQKLGLKVKVPNKVWVAAENAIRSGQKGAGRINTHQTPNKPTNGFTGF